MNIARLPRDAAMHVRLALIATAVEIADRLGENAPDFFDDYRQELDAFDIDKAGIEKWAVANPALPLNRLASAGLPRIAIDVLLTIGLAADDPRFADLIGEHGRPNFAALVGLWRMQPDGDRPQDVRAAINRLLACGLTAVTNPASPRADWAFAISVSAWDALSGDTPSIPKVGISAAEALPDLSEYIAPSTLTDRLDSISDQLRDDPETVLCLRGPARNGRATLAASLAKRLGRPLLRADATLTEQAEVWQQVGLVAFLLDAIVLVDLRTTPGATQALPAFPLGPVRLIVAAGLQGGIRIDNRPLSTIALAAPAFAERHRHWYRALPDASPTIIGALTAQFHVTSGTIIRAARAARGDPTVSSIRTALRDLQDTRLETIAARVETGDNPEFIALDGIARDEINALVVRCRNREALSKHTGPGPGGIGVRALFAGPSGAGKTLAARRLGHDLMRDVWRIDLAATVSKYIGETEKSLDRAFAAAEELDCILLLDEGDALMAKRTDVGNANDRYANLETNFLLQRIENFAGILIVTSNAADRIDPAFARRMDVVIPFRAPDELRRYEILEHHLGDHRASDDLLQEIAVRCALSGGQLRNVALHARLLGLDGGRPIGDRELRTAVEREYRKTEAHSPLKPLLSAVV
jgi:ATPase family associated with various cellular activities (AAA)